MIVTTKGPNDSTCLLGVTERKKTSVRFKPFTLVDCVSQTQNTESKNTLDEMEQNKGKEV